LQREVGIVKMSRDIKPFNELTTVLYREHNWIS